MIVQWTPDDIRAGRHVGKKGRNETWMIGYLAGSMRDDKQRWALVSTSDGMIQDATTAEGLAKILNEAGEQPIELL